MSLEDKIKEWYVISEKSKDLKKLEMSMRVEICEEMINGKAGRPLTSKEKAVVNFDNLQATAKAKTVTKLDEEVYDNLVEDEKLSPEELLCVKHRPSLVAAKLKNLDEKSKLFEAIYETPSAPGLTLKFLEE